MRIVALVAAAAAAGGCGSTQAVIEVVLGAGETQPAAIDVRAYGPRGAFASAARFDLAGRPLPGRVVLRLPDETQQVRVAVAGGPLLGGVRLEARAHEEVNAQLTIRTGTPDRDGDLVPDAIDNCPGESNTSQDDIDGDGQGDVCQAGGSDGGALDLSPTDGPYRINAIHPAVAETDQDVYIEGVFGASATVHFPGGVMAAPVEVTPARVRVKVPAGVREGALAVATDGAVTNGLPFRRASFPIAIQPFRVSEEQLAVARPPAEPQFTVAERSLVASGRLFLFGALMDDNVEAARINADDTLGPFKQVGRLTLNRHKASFTLVRDRIYVIGGYHNVSSSVLTSVEETRVHPDGSIDSFITTLATQLLERRVSHEAIVIGNWLYVIGGALDNNGNSPLATIERAEIRTDGSLGPFVAGGTLSHARYAFGAAVVGSWLYVFGGEDATGYVSQIERARISNDGTLQPFADVALGLMPSQRSGEFGVVRIGDSVYMVGGYLAGAPKTEVLRAQIQTNGDLGPFQQQPGGLEQARYIMGTAVAGNRVWAFGGSGGVHTAQHASIIGNNTLSQLSMAASNLTGMQAGMVLVTLGRNVYLVGGGNGSQERTNVWRATVQPDGTLSTFTDSGNPLRAAREGAAALVAGDSLYVVGGYPRKDVERATIADDGSLGTFQVVPGVELTKDRGSFVLVEKRGSVYAVAGDGSGTLIQDVERASLSATGVLGTFAVVGGVMSAESRESFAPILIGDTLHLVGGYNRGNAMPLSTTATLGFDMTGPTMFGTGTALPLMLSGHTAELIGSSLYLFAGQYQKACLRAGISASGAIGTYGSLTPVVELAAERWDHRSVTIGNHVYVVGGWRTTSALSTTMERAEIIP